MTSSRGVFHEEKWKNLLLSSTSIDVLGANLAAVLTVFCYNQCFFSFVLR